MNHSLLTFILARVPATTSVVAAGAQAPSAASVDQQVLINHFMLGAVALACGVAGLFFLRFWRKTRDRLFLIFAIAFWTLGLNWLALAFTSQDEIRTALYTVRLLAFVLILLGILDKNRARAPRGFPPQVQGS